MEALRVAYAEYEWGQPATTPLAPRVQIAAGHCLHHLQLCRGNSIRCTEQHCRGAATRVHGCDIQIRGAASNGTIVTWWYDCNINMMLPQVARPHRATWLLHLPVDKCRPRPRSKRLTTQHGTCTTAGCTHKSRRAITRSWDGGPSRPLAERRCPWRAHDMTGSAGGREWLWCVVSTTRSPHAVQDLDADCCAGLNFVVRTMVPSLLIAMLELQGHAQACTSVINGFPGLEA